MPNERVEKTVLLNPELSVGQTRLVYQWQTVSPEDMDLYVAAIKKDDNDLCVVYYDNKNCPGVTQDRDNVNGGTNGPETVTFQDPSINNLYTYVVGIDDFAFENNGVDFFNSGSTINVANNLQTHDVTMVGNTGNSTNTYYFYGCIEFLQNGTFTYTDVPQGIFFNGEPPFTGWLDLKNTYC